MSIKFKGIVGQSKFSKRVYELCLIGGKEVWINSSGGVISAEHIINIHKVR